ncbi:MAG: DUF948 domain-containing protein [Peptostreptococcaceae bacterium]|nr:DUF948 domain-containing protein [Peptostreptococcaceae bacterium]
MNIWELGILLMGIGVLILCIFAATTIRDLGATFKKIDRMLTDRNGEIDTIITNAASISTEVEGIAQNVNKVTDITGFVGSVTESISNIFKKEDRSDEFYKNYSPSDLEEDDDLDEILQENYERARKQAKRSIQKTKEAFEDVSEDFVDDLKKAEKRTKHMARNGANNAKDPTEDIKSNIED